MFADTELVARIERAERDLVAAGANAVARRAGAPGATRALVLPIAGGAAVFAGRDSPLTKVVGLGFAGAPSDAELERMEAEFAARGAAVQVELASLAESGIAERLTRRGYALVGFENVLGLPLGAGLEPAARAGIRVEPSGDAELETWLDVVVTAFAAPDAQGLASHESHPREAIESAMRDMTGAGELLRYLARREGTPAGGASMRVGGAIAQLCGAGTLPAHRRHGVQAALLERRLADAAAAGCELAVVTTLPGSKSQANTQRRGFELLYTRAVLRRA